MKPSQLLPPRGFFTSNYGFLMAAIGAVLGLGSFWRFPYIVHAYGGGAFLIPYVIAMLTTGIPVMVLEYGLGHHTQASAPLALARVDPKLESLGWFMPLLAMFGILLYYQVVLGWCVNFGIFAHDLHWGSDPQKFFFEKFLGLTVGPGSLGGLRWEIVASTAGIWTITAFIGWREIHRGIERACAYFMPVLFVATVVLVIWALTLPGAAEGIRFYLVPQWDKLLDYRVWMAAYTQTFFTLSLGFGIMIAYASYLPKRNDLVLNAGIASVTDLVFSLLAGLAVFAVLGYLAVAKGVGVAEVVRSGPALVFMVLPEAINRLPFLRELFGVLFFGSLVIAGLATSVAIQEAAISAIQDKFGIARKPLVAMLCGLGFLGSLVFTTGGGLFWLDILDHFLNQYGVVLAGLLECVLIGRYLKLAALRSHVNQSAWWKLNRGWDWMILYLTPAVLLVNLVRSLADELPHGYAGYSSLSLWGIGMTWLVAVAVAALVLTRYPWEPRRFDADHAPGSDELFKGGPLPLWKPKAKDRPKTPRAEA